MHEALCQVQHSQALLRPKEEKSDQYIAVGTVKQSGSPDMAVCMWVLKRLLRR